MMVPMFYGMSVPNYGSKRRRPLPSRFVRFPLKPGKPNGGLTED